MNEKTIAWLTLAVSVATLAIAAKFAYEAKAAQGKAEDVKKFLGF